MYWWHLGDRRADVASLTCIVSVGSWCNHACLPALGSGCVWAGLQPVHRRAAVGAVPRCSHGVQAGVGSPAVLLGHCLWQQHLPERARLRPASPLPGGHLRKPSESHRPEGISVEWHFDTVQARKQIFFSVLFSSCPSLLMNCNFFQVLLPQMSVLQFI